MVGTVALFAVVGYKVLVGEINLHGMLSDETTGQLSAGRLQLLLVTIGGATYYLFEVLSAGGVRCGVAGARANPVGSRSEQRGLSREQGVFESLGEPGLG